MTWGEGARDGAAVVIGVGEYLHAERVRPLRFAARDAKAIAGALIDPAVCGFPAEGVKLLTDANACRDAVAHHLSKWLPEQARQAEIVVIYFAGHGAIHGVGRREEGYLLAHDADPEDLATRGILMTDVARWIEAIEAGAVVVCLDCCHAAKVIPRGGLADDVTMRDMRMRPALFQALAGRRRYLIASCDDGQVSVEADCWGHGLFTHHLLAGLRGAGDRDDDGRVGIAELFEYVSEAVERDAKAMGMVQKPWISATGPGGVILSIRAGKGEGPRSPTSRPTPLRDAERIWRERGSVAAIREIGPAMESASAEELIRALELLGTMRDPAGVPLLFRCLKHASEPVRERAKQVIQSFGWERVTATIKDLARRGEEAQVSPILDGLAAFEAHEEIVALLDQLSTLLKDTLRNRAILLLERKQQGLEFERVAALFRETRSPYQILKPLGQGLFTAAYLARDETNELDVVIRVLRPEFACWPQIRAQFLDLARRSVKLVHQNLVLTRDVRDFAERRIYYAVRDYVEGVTLQRLLEAGRSFGPSQILQVLRQVLLALTPIHGRGMAHGSIKPSNIFLCGEDRVILGDLAIPACGVGVHLDRLSYDYRYASPEMFQQGSALSPRSDLYSVGCLAYELACGAPPFISDNPYELAGKHCREPVEPPGRRGSHLGSEGDSLILRLLNKDHSGRFADVHAALRALDHLEPPPRPKAKGQAPPAPLLGDASLIRYASDDRMSIVSLWAGMRLPEDPAEQKSLVHEEVATPAAGEGRDPDTTLGSVVIAAKGGGEELGVAAAPEPQPGERFGPYQIIRQLGSGGMGSVFLALHTQLGRQVAIKVNRHPSLGGPEAQQRFSREARVVARLEHPNIVPVYDVGQIDGHFYTVFKYVPGRDLRQKLSEDGLLPPREASELLMILARAVRYAHSLGIIHRDLKPSNILLDEADKPLISDFGLARLDSERHDPEDIYRTSEGMILGTPAYMSPEQARGEIDRIGPATDIYSLGAMFYELLTGEVPFRGRTPVDTLADLIQRPPRPPREIRPEIPRPVEAICLKCLEKEVAHRYATAGALAEDLERFLEDRPISSRMPGFWDRARKLLPFRRQSAGKGHPAP
jgi:serine/threonine protein kinase